MPRGWFRAKLHSPRAFSRVMTHLALHHVPAGHFLNQMID
jgi:hypothetical protein